MNIKITPTFTKADLKKDIDASIKRMQKITISEISMVGLEFVRIARTKTKASGGFNDITGNLRSSIGFIVMYDGQILEENFERSSEGTDRGAGYQKGMEFARSVGKDYPKGYALITVAGMEYAAAVEALNYDVISGSTLDAKSLMREVWKEVSLAFKAT